MAGTVSSDWCRSQNLTGNVVYNNTLNGISLSGSNWNNLSGNLITNNTQNGISLSDH